MNGCILYELHSGVVTKHSVGGGLKQSHFGIVEPWVDSLVAGAADGTNL
jgi:hypothetical protein